MLSNFQNSKPSTLWLHNVSKTSWGSTNMIEYFKKLCSNIKPAESSALGKYPRLSFCLNSPLFIWMHEKFAWIRDMFIFATTTYKLYLVHKEHGVPLTLSN